MKDMTNHARNPITQPSKAPLSTIVITRDDRVVAPSLDPIATPTSVQPSPARAASLMASGPFSGETAVWVGENASETERTILAAMRARPATTVIIRRALETATRDNYRPGESSSLNHYSLPLGPFRKWRSPVSAAGFPLDKLHVTLTILGED